MLLYELFSIIFFHLQEHKYLSVPAHVYVHEPLQCSITSDFALSYFHIFDGQQLILYTHIQLLLWGIIFLPE